MPQEFPKYNLANEHKETLTIRVKTITVWECFGLTLQSSDGSVCQLSSLAARGKFLPIAILDKI